MPDQSYQVKAIAPELLKALDEVLSIGYGEIRIVIYKGKISLIEKKESVKVRCKDSQDSV